MGDLSVRCSHPLSGDDWLYRVRGHDGAALPVQKTIKLSPISVLQSYLKGGRVMVISRKDILGIFDLETNDLLCSNCCPTEEIWPLIPDILLTEKDAEKGKIYFCDGCGRLILET